MKNIAQKTRILQVITAIEMPILTEGYIVQIKTNPAQTFIFVRKGLSKSEQFRVAKALICANKNLKQYRRSVSID